MVKDYRAKLTVNVSAKRGLAIGWHLFWSSIVALVRRTTVTFEAWNESDARVPDWRDVIWHTLESDPEFNEGMARAKEEHDTIGFQTFRHRYVRPRADEDVVDYGLGTLGQQAEAARRIEEGKADITIIEGGP